MKEEVMTMIKMPGSRYMPKLKVEPPALGENDLFASVALQAFSAEMTTYFNQLCKSSII